VLFYLTKITIKENAIRKQKSYSSKIKAMLYAKENVENYINKLINKIIRDSVKPLLYKKYTMNEIKNFFTENTYYR